MNQEAELFYKSIREEDDRLTTIEGRARYLVRKWTGYEAVNVGSFALLLNLPSSDLDLSMGAIAQDFDAVCEEIANSGCQFIATRESRPGSFRKVYRFQIDSIDIDLAVLRDDDLFLLMPGLVRCRRGMTYIERVEHVYEKQRLYKTNNKRAYFEFKMKPYLKYCPEFSWLKGT